MGNYLKYSFLRISGTSHSFYLQRKKKFDNLRKLGDKSISCQELQLYEKKKALIYLEKKISFSSGKEKLQLINIKQQIFNNCSNIKNITDDKLKSILGNLKRREILYCTTRKKLTDRFTSDLEQEERLLLNHCLKNENFKKALVISSPTLLNALKNYKDLRSKRKKAALYSLLKFYFRMTYKTTPFSYFTFLNLLNSNTSPPNNSGELTSYKTLNISLFRNVIMIIKFSPKFNHRINIKLNTTITLSNGNYFFYICDTRNKDNIVSIQASPSAKYIYSLLSKKKCCTYGDIVNLLSNEFNFNGKYSDIIDKLLAIGFIQYAININFLSHNFLKEFTAFICNIFPKKNHKFFIRHLTKLELLVDDRQIYSFDKYLKTYTEIKATLRTIIIKILMLAGDSNPANLNRIKTFAYKMESILKNPFYEDIFVQESITPGLRAYNYNLSSVTKLLQCLRNTNLRQDYEFVFENFMRNTYQVDSTIKVLKVFEDFTKYRQLQQDIGTDILSAVRRNFLEKICAFKESSCQYNDVWNINLCSNDIEALRNLPIYSLKQKKARKESKSIFFQPINTESLVINGFAIGYGKWYSRFLNHIRGESLTDFIKNNYVEFDNKILNIENSDALCGNANIHPPLLKYELEIPGGYNLDNGTSKISLNDLYIKVLEDDIILYHKPSKKAVNIYDLGFYSNENRSSFFKFLDYFNPILDINLEYFNDLVIVALQKIKSSTVIINSSSYEIKRCARITLDNKIILSRQYWLISKVDLLSILNTKSIAEKYERLRILLRSCNIPEEVFLHVRPRADLKDIKSLINKDDYKPLYINFSSPLFINLLEKEINKSTSYVRLTEMLPSSDDNLKNRQGRAYEILSQVKY